MAKREIEEVEEVDVDAEEAIADSVEEAETLEVEEDDDEQIDEVKGNVIQRQEYSQQLECKLTAEEISEAANKMARAAQILTEVADSKKTANAQFKAQADSAQADINRYGQLVRSKVEMRSVRCEKVMNYVDGQVEEIRLDTDEIIHTREMTEDEKQMGLQL